MAVFTNAQEITQIVNEVLTELRSSPGRAALLEIAASAFEAQQATVAIVTSDPDASCFVDLTLGRVDSPASGVEATAKLEIEADLLHEMMMGTLHSGAIAHAYDDGRMKVSGPPSALRALLPIATAFSALWQKAAIESPRADALVSVKPRPAALWSVEPVSPEVFIGQVIPSRRRKTDNLNRSEGELRT
jgi:hypothetical protein